MKGGNLKVSYCLIRQETVNSIHWFTISSQMSVPIVGLLVNWQVMHSSAICSWEVTEKTLLHHSISQLSCFVKARRCLQSILSWLVSVSVFWWQQTATIYEYEDINEFYTKQATPPFCSFWHFVFISVYWKCNRPVLDHKIYVDKWHLTR